MELTREELLRRLRISARELEEWTENDLLSPVPGQAGLFPETALEEGELIRKFSSLGYALPEIRKIKKSVGLPARDEKGRPLSRTDFLTIGELAEKSGINARTIKFWEEKGLIAPHRRTEGGFRLYRPGDVRALQFIKDLQAFNYTLAEIGTILKLAGPDPGSAEAELTPASREELEKAEGALRFLIERMQEARDASTRVEAVFERRLRAVSRVLKARRSG